MRQKGFSTILGLCLILVIALTVRGIQEAETNHAYETADFQTEMELQNSAESGIVAAVADVHSGKRKLTTSQLEFKRITNKPPYAKNLGNITVRTWGQLIKNFQQYKVKYNDADETKNVAVKSNESDKNVYFFFSIAQAKNNHTGGTVYRRATAYVVVDDDAIDDAIHFMETPMSTYKFTK